MGWSAVRLIGVSTTTPDAARRVLAKDLEVHVEADQPMLGTAAGGVARGDLECFAAQFGAPWPGEAFAYGRPQGADGDPPGV